MENLLQPNNPNNITRILNYILNKIKKLTKLVEENSGGAPSRDYIPLSGTEVGKPVTGDIKFTSNENETLQIGAYGIEDGIQIVVGSEANYNNLTVNNISTSISCVNNLDETSIGIVISQENGIQIKENNEAFIATEESHITSKKYADLQHSYSTEEIKTGGTWIDGKPIYRKVLLQSLVGSSGSSFIELLNVEDVVSLNGVYIDGDDEVTQILPYYRYSYIIDFFYGKSDGGVYIDAKASDVPVTVGIVKMIVEYTKTTD